MEHLTDEQQVAMLQEAEKYAKGLAQFLGKDDDYVKLEAEQYCDPVLTIGGVLQICAYMEAKPNAISQTPAPRFLIGHSVLVPGVRYYADGSGEPDTEDFLEDETDITHAKSAVTSAFRMCNNWEFEQQLEVLEEQRMCAEMQNYEW